MNAPSNALQVYLTFGWSEGEILSVELGRHPAPDLGALNASQEAHRLQLEPVGLVQLGPNEEVEIGDLVVLAHERRSETELAVRLRE